MGLMKKGCTVYPEGKCYAPNPNPARFKIVSTEQIGNHVVAQIKYPDCRNYEGNKVLLFLETSEDGINYRTTIDPHFDDNDKAPFARFKPTNAGWNAAVKIARLL